MIKTVLKIDGMMCGMCESHMNDVVRKSCSPKKVNSSAKNGETVVISEAPLDIPYLKQQIKDIGYELVSYTSEPYEKKGESPMSRILVVYYSVSNGNTREIAHQMAEYIKADLAEIQTVPDVRLSLQLKCIWKKQYPLSHRKQ